MKAKHCGGWISSLLVTLFWFAGSWLLSLPAWVTLILHFVIDLPLWWFFATLGLWLLVGILRWLLVRFARWGGTQSPPPAANKNPYSAGNNLFPPSRDDP